MRKISAANSVASSPPVPARISSTTFFSSLGSLGSSRILSSLFDPRQLRLQAARFLPRPWRAGRGRCSCEHGARLRKRIFARCFHSRYLADHFGKFAVRLGDFAVLVARRRSRPDRPSAGSARRSAFRADRASERIAWRVSGDDQFAALRFFQRHGAFERVDGDRRLVVGRRLGGDALQPQAGRGERGQERAAAAWRRSGSVRSSARRSAAAAAMRASSLAAKPSNGISA